MHSFLPDLPLKLLFLQLLLRYLIYPSSIIAVTITLMSKHSNSINATVFAFVFIISAIASCVDRLVVHHIAAIADNVMAKLISRSSMLLSLPGLPAGLGVKWYLFYSENCCCGPVARKGTLLSFVADNENVVVRCLVRNY